jgi:hypothetical protein
MLKARELSLSMLKARELLRHHHLRQGDGGWGRRLWSVLLMACS